MIPAKRSTIVEDSKAVADEHRVQPRDPDGAWRRDLNPHRGVVLIEVHVEPASRVEGSNDAPVALPRAGQDRGHEAGRLRVATCVDSSATTGAPSVGTAWLTVESQRRANPGETKGFGEGTTHALRGPT